MRATAMGTTSVIVTASDQNGGEAEQVFDASIRRRPEVIFRETFDSAGSLKDWEKAYVDSPYVSNGVLHLDISDSVKSPEIPHIREDLPEEIDKYWTATARYGLKSGSLCSAFFIFTGNSDYPAWFFDIDYEDKSWLLFVLVAEDGWRSLLGGSNGIDYDLGDFTTLTLEFNDGVVSGRVGSRQLFRSSYGSGGGSWPPSSITGVGFGGQGCFDDGTVIVDWVEAGTG